MAHSSFEDTHVPDPTAINLSSLLSRLEHTLLAPDAKSRARTSSYERARIGAVSRAHYPESTTVLV